jgi:hypothetical protein
VGEIPVEVNLGTVLRIPCSFLGNSDAAASRQLPQNLVMQALLIAEVIMQLIPNLFRGRILQMPHTA